MMKLKYYSLIFWGILIFLLVGFIFMSLILIKGFAFFEEHVDEAMDFMKALLFFFTQFF